MSDLQCPATLLVLGRAGWPSRLELPQDRNIAAVYCPADEIDAAARLADELDVALRPVQDLILAQGEAESLDEGDGWTAVHAALRGIADLHRGETVVVLTATAGQARQIRIDADGWAASSLEG